MITIRKSDQRGHADLGWLKSKHSFSFGSYYDARQMGFSALRVINDDTVLPSSGFDTHGHSNMEIISYPLNGVIAHKDSEGNIASVPSGEVQVMSAGSGIRHSEFNPSSNDSLHFLQIWIEPNTLNGPPNYQQKKFSHQPGLTLLASSSGESGSLQIKQDARLYQLLLEPQQAHTFKMNTYRKYYIHLIEGVLAIGEVHLTPGDGAKIESSEQLNFEAQAQVKALIFDLP